MGSSPPNRTIAVVIDANVAIAIAAKETGKETLARAELGSYTRAGAVFYAPGILVAETLYILCQQMNALLLTPVQHLQAVTDFEILMQNVLPPPNGDASLIRRAEQIRSNYGCSRSADGLYIALAEQLSLTATTTVLTFDQGLVNQAASNAPSVRIHLLTAAK